MAYDITTEDRGHGIIAVYVTGPDTEIAAIDRAGQAYARQTWGKGGPVSSGGRWTGDGVYIAQQVYVTRPLTPREG